MHISRCKKNFHLVSGRMEKEDTMTTSGTRSPELPKPSRQLQKALVYYAAFLVLGIAVSALGPTLQSLADQTNSSLSQISIIFAGNSLGYVIGSLLGGWLYDRQRGHPVLAVTLSVLSILLFTLPLAASLWLLVAILMVIGFGMGIIDVGGNTLIVWLFGRAVGPYMNALHLAFGVGALLSPMLVDRVVVATGGIRWFYWSVAILVVPVLLWFTRLPSPPPPASTGEHSAETAPRSHPWLILMIAGLFFMHVGTELGFGGWVFSYAVAMKVGPETLARVLNSTYWGGLTLGRVVSIPIAIKVRPKTMLLLDILGALVSIGLLLLIPVWPPVIWIATFGLGFSLASMFPSTINFAERRIPITGKVTGYFLVGANAGSMTVPWLIGQWFESAGPQSMLLILGSAMSLALLLLLGLLRYSKHLTPESEKGR